MPTTAHAAHAPHPDRRLSHRRAGSGSEVGLARVAIGVVALHVVDDSFLQPNPGTSAADHVLGGLVPLALLVAAGVFYARLRAGARATSPSSPASSASSPAPRRCTTRWPSAPRETTSRASLSILAGLTLLGLGVVTLWTSRRRDDRLWWRYSRRLLSRLGTLFLAVVRPLPGRDRLRRHPRRPRPRSRRRPRRGVRGGASSRRATDCSSAAGTSRRATAPR